MPRSSPGRTGMLTGWVVTTPCGKAFSGPIAIKRNSPDVPVGRHTSSEAEPAPGPPKAPQDVMIQEPSPGGTGGTMEDGEAGAVACWTTVKFAAPAPRG